MQETLAVLTPPATPAVPLADLKLHLRVEVDADDALIAALGDAAAALVEARLKMALVSREYLWALDAFPNRLATPMASLLSARWLESRTCPFSQLQVLRPPNPPLVAVAEVRYLDVASNTWTTLDPSAYVVAPGTPGRVAPGPGTAWPATADAPGAVAVRYTAGFGPDASTVPPNLVAAVKLLVGGWYRNREAVADVALVEIPFGVRALIDTSAYGFHA